MPENTDVVRADLVELMEGGFAPVVILLREFDHKKASVVLDGLPYSAWSLLGHMHNRQELLLSFMRGSNDNADLWPEPYWPDNNAPGDEVSWNSAIDNFERDLTEMRSIVDNKNIPLFEVRDNGKSLYWAALAAVQHNSYHIGQIKAIGRQLGVW